MLKHLQLGLKLLMEPGALALGLVCLELSGTSSETPTIPCSWRRALVSHSCTMLSTAHFQGSLSRKCLPLLNFPSDTKAEESFTPLHWEVAQLTWEVRGMSNKQAFVFPRGRVYFSGTSLNLLSDKNKIIETRGTEEIHLDLLEVTRQGRGLRK